MNFTQDLAAIATKELYSHLEQQISAVAPEPPKIRIAIRKAKYHDKARIRLKRAKEVALIECGWGTTANVKKYLAVLGINLDLRYTSSWIALYFDLKPQIDAAKAIVDALTPRPMKRTFPSCEELLEQAIVDGAIASWTEDEEGGLYWIHKTPDSKPDLVTSTYLPMYLRRLPVQKTELQAA